MGPLLILTAKLHLMDKSDNDNGSDGTMFVDAASTLDDSTDRSSHRAINEGNEHADSEMGSEAEKQNMVVVVKNDKNETVIDEHGLDDTTEDTQNNTDEEDGVFIVSNDSESKDIDEEGRALLVKALYFFKILRPF